MLRFRYLVGYVAESKQGQNIASAIINREKPIFSSADIDEVQFVLQTKCKVEKVMLLSFSKMEDFNDVFG